MNNKESTIERLNNESPGLIKMLGGKLIDFDVDESSCLFEFNIGTNFCHSIDVVQGGFITAMLDVAMCHSVFSGDKTIVGVSSLEIKTSYLDVTRAGKLRLEGKTIKQSYKTAFMEGRVYNEDNVLTATGSSVGKIIRIPSK